MARFNRACVGVVVTAVWGLIGPAGFAPVARAQDSPPPETSDAAPATTVLRCGRIVDVRAGALLPAGDVVVQGDEIVAVGDSGAGAGGTVIDLSSATCMPGLMDMHTHLSGELSPMSWAEGLSMGPASIVLRASVFARRTLDAGFTTVRDLGDIDNITVALRDAIAAGLVPGPRIFTAAKALGSTGGHADPTNGLREDLFDAPGPTEGVVDGVDAARRAVRQRYKEGADLIKITATGGVLSLAKNGQNPQFTEDEIRAIVETARDYGFHVAAHAHGAEGMKRAIRAGVRSIEHGTLLDDEVLRLMKEHGTFLVPTISAGRFVTEKAALDGWFPPVIRPKAAEIGPKIDAMVTRAWAAGVRIAFGTDAGVSPHGDNGKEFGFMAEAGIPVLAAIRTATLDAAELLGIEDRLGTLEVGRVADVVAVAGNPVDDVSTLERPVFVMKAGAIHLQR